jgi:uncharacterized protein
MREKLNEAVKAAMRAKDATRLTTLRMVTSKIKDIEVLNVRPAGQELASEAEILDVLAKMVKQRRDSIEAFEKMARTDLADKEKAEIVILEEFMPKGLSEAEMRDAITGVIKSSGAAGPKDMGKVMGALKAQFAGRMDFGKASGMVKELLK